MIILSLKCILILAFIIFLIITFYAIIHRNILSAQILMILCICCAIYSGGYALELNAEAFDVKVFWNIIQYIAFPFIPGFWLLFIIYDKNKQHYITPLKTILLFLPPFATVIARLTNSYHHLFYSDLIMIYYSVPMLRTVKGPLFYIIYFSYSFFCIAFSAKLLLQDMHKMDKRQKGRTIVLFIVFIFPCSLLILNLLGIRLYEIDWFVIALSFSVLVLIRQLTKYRLVDETQILINELQRNEDLLRILLDSINTVIFIIDKYTNQVKTINNTYYELFGDDLNKNIEQVTKQISDRVCEKDKKITEDFFNQLNQSVIQFDNIRIIEFRILNKNKQYIWIRMSLRAVKSSNKEIRHIIGTITNIHQERSKLEELVQKAEYDSSTGVYNKGTANQKIASYLSIKENQQENNAFLLIDIDDLKAINDANGHNIGDKIINDIAKILQHHFGDNSIIGRIGGDEFVVFQKNYQKKENLENLMLKSIESINELQQKFEIQTKVSISIGIALSPYDGIIFDDLYIKADLAMYKIKETKKDGYKYYDASLQFKEE